MSVFQRLSDPTASLVTLLQLSPNPGVTLAEAVRTAAERGGKAAGDAVITELTTFACASRRAAAGGPSFDSLRSFEESEQIYAAIDAFHELPAAERARFASEPRPAGMLPQLRTSGTAPTISYAALRSVLWPRSGDALAQRITDTSHGGGIAGCAKTLANELESAEARHGSAAARQLFADLKSYVQIASATADGSYTRAWEIPAIIAATRAFRPDLIARLTSEPSAVDLTCVAGLTVDANPRERKLAILSILASVFPATVSRRPIGSPRSQERPIWGPSNVHLLADGTYELHVPEDQAERLRANLAAFDVVERPAYVIADKGDRRSNEDQLVKNVSADALRHAGIKNGWVAQLSFDQGYSVELSAPGRVNRKADVHEVAAAVSQALEDNGQPWTRVAIKLQ